MGDDFSPTDEVLVVVEDDGGRRVETMRWGLIPPWADDPKMGSRLINARAETVFEKPSFKRAIWRRRCLIVADGYYEWQRRGRRKVPYHVRLKSGRSFGFAGLWETWRSPDGNVVTSCAIVTVEANGLVRPIHHRMPVVVAKADEPTWLNPNVRDRTELGRIMTPYPSDEMEANLTPKRTDASDDNSAERALPLDLDA